MTGVTRRKMVLAASVGAVASAQQQPAQIPGSPEEELQAARKNTLLASERLAAHELQPNVQPAFVFKAV